MEVINKRHPDILQNTRVTLANYVRVDKKEMYFSAGCNSKYGIMAGLYVHFVNDGDRWMFYVNSEKDGFPLLSRPKKTSSFISNISLNYLFIKRTQCSLGTKFPIQITNSKMKDSPLYEILINKAFN